MISNVIDDSEKTVSNIQRIILTVAPFSFAIGVAAKTTGNGADDFILLAMIAGWLAGEFYYAILFVVIYPLKKKVTLYKRAIIIIGITGIPVGLINPFFPFLLLSKLVGIFTK